MLKTKAKRTTRRPPKIIASKPRLFGDLLRGAVARVPAFGASELWSACSGRLGRLVRLVRLARLGEAPGEVPGLGEGRVCREGVDGRPQFVNARPWGRDNEWGQDYHEARCNLGLVLAAKGDLAGAETAVRDALRFSDAAADQSKIKAILEHILKLSV